MLAYQYSLDCPYMVQTSHRDPLYRTAFAPEIAINQTSIIHSNLLFLDHNKRNGYQTANAPVI